MQEKSHLGAIFLGMGTTLLEPILSVSEFFGRSLIRLRFILGLFGAYIQGTRDANLNICTISTKKAHCGMRFLSMNYE